MHKNIHELRICSNVNISQKVAEFFVCLQTLKSLLLQPKGNNIVTTNVKEKRYTEGCIHLTYPPPPLLISQCSVELGPCSTN